jgi:protein required for attachment to host cells
MRKVWVVVANSGLAKIYRAENRTILVEHGIFFHEESHLPARELVSDHHGRETQRKGYGSESMEAKTPLKMKEALLFAVQIARFLEEGYNKKEYERLYIIAKPPFLGYLRQSLHHNVAKLVDSEIHKDLTQSKPEEVRDYLPPVL